MRLHLLERDDEAPRGGRDRGGVVPLEVVRRPVVQVDGFPVGVVPWVERPTVDVELVGEDELVDPAVKQRGFGVCGFGRGGVDEPPRAWDVWDLYGGDAQVHISF